MMYSIITCVYNAKEYLDRYFKSIEHIDYSDFEIIIVDDCSTDGTGEIIKTINEKSKSYKIIYKQLDKNYGPGYARNEGVKIATGDNIIFVDIDDQVDSHIFNILNQFESFDIVCFDYFTFNKKNMTQRKSTIINPDIPLFSIRDLMKRVTGCVWGKRFKKSIIDRYSILFPELFKSEDIVFLMKYLLKCNTFEYCKEALYYYRLSENSLMHRNIQNQIKYARIAMKILNQETEIPQDVFKIVYLKEIIYDLTNIYIKIGKSKNELKTFWNEEQIDWTILNNQVCFSKNQIVVLLMIKNELYLGLRIINRFR